MDADLVRRAQEGDEQAFAALALTLGGRLHAVAARVLRDPDLAEDASQQALIAIWRDLPKLRDPARVEAWAYRLLVRACYAQGRRERRWAPQLHLLDTDAISPDELRGIDDRDQLEQAFRRLSVNHRAVIVLHHYLDMSLEHVAATLGIPTGTARSRLHYALRSMRASIDADARPLQEVAR